MRDLPDIGGLVAVPAVDWQSLRHRLLAIGVDAAAVAPIHALCARYPEDDRNPIRLWHLRRRSDAAAMAMRLLMFGDALTIAETIATFGEPLVTLLSTAGLLLADSDQVHCVLRLAMAGDDYVFADDLRPGGDAVMGLRETTVPLWRAAVPSQPVSRALDLACGAGAIALLLCRHSAQVVATDINPRAVAMARINVALNGVANIDVRQGDLFAPVAGEAFDLIATHPPYVALPDGVPAFRTCMAVRAAMSWRAGCWPGWHSILQRVVVPSFRRTGRCATARHRPRAFEKQPGPNSICWCLGSAQLMSMIWRRSGARFSIVTPRP